MALLWVDRPRSHLSFYSSSTLPRLPLPRCPRSGRPPSPKENPFLNDLWLTHAYHRDATGTFPTQLTAAPGHLSFPGQEWGASALCPNCTLTGWSHGSSSHYAWGLRGSTDPLSHRSTLRVGLTGLYTGNPFLKINYSIKSPPVLCNL